MSAHGRKARSILFRRQGVTRSRSCTNKSPLNRKEAMKRAAERSVETKQNIQAYECLFCPFWHIGHPPRRLKR